MVKAGSFLMRSPLTVVMVCPGGCGSEPGPGCNPGVAADDAGAGAAAADTGARGAATGRGPGAGATRSRAIRLGGSRLDVMGLTTTSGTATWSGGRAAGGLASGAADVGADGPPSGFGASVVAGGGEDSCACPGSGTGTATAQTAAKNQKRRQDNMARSESTRGANEKVDIDAT